MTNEQINAIADRISDRLISIVKKQLGEADPEALTIADYENVLTDHRRLVRELDVTINGDKAAQQASLVDLVCQIRGLWRERPAGPRWLKASEPSIEEGEYVAKFKPDNKKRDARGVAFVDNKYARFLCPPYHDIIWSRNHEELQYLQLLDGNRPITHWRPLPGGREIKHKNNKKCKCRP